MNELKPGDQVTVARVSQNSLVWITESMVVGEVKEDGFYNEAQVFYQLDEYWTVTRHDPKPAWVSEPCIGAIIRVLEQHGSSEWRTTVFVRESEYRWTRTGIGSGMSWEMVQNYLDSWFVKKVEVFADGE